MALEIINLSKSYGNLRLFENLSLSLAESQITVILGPSGCGKTTMLNMLSGADAGYQGQIKLPDNFSAGYLFQEPRLLPWKSVRDNLKFVLSGKIGDDKLDALIDQYLDLVGLSDFDRYRPGALSGGMKQRAAMARAFAYPAQAIFMDEPFQGLDVNLKLQLTEAFLNLWKRESKTAVYVTHDIQEALLLGSRIIVFSAPPVSVKEDFEITIPQDCRSLEDPEIGRYERRLYTALAHREPWACGD